MPEPLSDPEVDGSGGMGWGAGMSTPIATAGDSARVSVKSCAIAEM